MTEARQPVVPIFRDAGRPAEPSGDEPAARAELAPASLGPRQVPSPQVGRHVRLNLGVLRSHGIITPDNMASVAWNEFRLVKRELVRRSRDPATGDLNRNLVMITSSLPGEGKTYTACNLGIGLAAERDLQVLLIEADISRPSLAKFFAGSAGLGLTDYLDGSCTDLTEVLCQCDDLPNLSVIFAGSRSSQAPELLASRRMAELCAELSAERADRIVIMDTAPLLATAEPAALAMHVHQLVMVVAAEQSTRSQVANALATVSFCPQISLLFNKAPRWSLTAHDDYYGTAPAAKPGRSLPWGGTR